MSEYWDNLTAGKKVKIILMVILCIFIITFAIVNWQRSEVNFIFFRVSIPITLLIIICTTIGYLISTLYESRHYNEKVREIGLLNEEIARLNATIENGNAPAKPAGDQQEEII